MLGIRQGVGFGCAALSFAKRSLLVLPSLFFLGPCARRSLSFSPVSPVIWPSLALRRRPKPRGTAMLLSIAKCSGIAPPRRRQLLNSSLYSSINEGRRRHRGWLRRQDSNLCISESEFAQTLSLGREDSNLCISKSNSLIHYPFELAHRFAQGAGDCLRRSHR